MAQARGSCGQILPNVYDWRGVRRCWTVNPIVQYLQGPAADDHTERAAHMLCCSNLELPQPHLQAQQQQYSYL